MQDGYHFATAPWLIGDGQVIDDTSIRRGQVVRIGAEPEGFEEQSADTGQVPEKANVVPDYAPVSVMLLATDRVAATAEQPASSNPVRDIDQVFDRLLAQQDNPLARLEQALQDGFTRLEQRLADVLDPSPFGQQTDQTLAAIAQEQAAQAEALLGFAAGFEALTTRLAAAPVVPVAHDGLLRDVSDIRAGLTELRVQARMIEMQLFSLGRGPEVPFARGTATDTQLQAS